LSLKLMVIFYLHNQGRTKPPKHAVPWHEQQLDASVKQVGVNVIKEK